MLDQYLFAALPNESLFLSPLSPITFTHPSTSYLLASYHPLSISINPSTIQQFLPFIIKLSFCLFTPAFSRFPSSVNHPAISSSLEPPFLTPYNPSSPASLHLNHPLNNVVQTTSTSFARGHAALVNATSILFMPAIRQWAIATFSAGINTTSRYPFQLPLFKLIFWKKDKVFGKCI